MGNASLNKTTSGKSPTTPTANPTSTSTSSPSTHNTPIVSAAVSWAAMAKKNTSPTNPKIVDQPVDTAEAKFYAWWAAREKDLASMTPDEHDAKFPKDSELSSPAPLPVPDGDSVLTICR